MIEHNYKNLEGWFNMENQYLELLEATPEEGIFVELGAYKGKSTSFIVTEMVNRGRKINFFTIDTFEGDSGSNDLKEVEAYKQVDVSNMYFEYLKNIESIREFYQTLIMPSNEGATLFDDNSVDAIFIDAGHSYEAVIADIKAWLPKMKDGSIMAGHDYSGWPGVGKAVRELLGTPDKVENDCWFIKIKK